MRADEEEEGHLTDCDIGVLNIIIIITIRWNYCFLGGKYVMHSRATYDHTFKEVDSFQIVWSLGS